MLGWARSIASPPMDITLYGIRLSHPVLSAKLMLERKGVPFSEKTLIGGLHPPMLALNGFKPETVPPLRLGDRKVQGTLAISRALDEVLPDRPTLFPTDAAARADVEAAERWGEGELQPVPRRIIRRALCDSFALRAWFADVASPFPAPRITAIPLTVAAQVFARQAGATKAQVETDRAQLDALLTRVYELLSAGVIGGDEVTAADCQIAPSVAMLHGFDGLRDEVERHAPAAEWALRLVPDYPRVPA